MSDDSFLHDEETFQRRRFPSGVDIQEGEARYAELVAEVIWDGLITAESRLRLNTAQQVFGVPEPRAKQIEASVIASQEARHRIRIIEEDEDDDDITLEAPPIDRVSVVPLAASNDPRLAALQRRIRALEEAAHDAAEEKRRRDEHAEALEQLVDQLQNALESTLEELDDVSRKLDAHEKALEARKVLTAPPGTASSRARSEPPRQSEPIAEESGEIPLPLASMTHVAGLHGHFADEPDHPISERVPRGPWEGPIAAMRARRNNPDEIHARFRKAPRDASLLHALFEALGRADDTDRRWCVAHALVFLGDATVHEQAFHEEHRRDGLVRPTRAVNDDEWRELLYHPEEDPLIGDILSAIAPSVLLGHLAGMRASIAPEMLDPSLRVDPKQSTLQAVRCLAWAADILGIITPAIYVEREARVTIDIVLNPVPVTRLGAGALSGRTAPELAFLAGRHLTWYRREHLLGQPNRSVRRLEDMFLAALMIGNPGLPMAPEVKTRVEPVARSIRPLLDATAVKRLEEGFSAFVEGGGRTNLSRWYRSAERTAACAGLLLSNDLAVASSMLALEGKRDPEAFDELVIFFTAARASLLRQRIGISIQ
jgi:hypothetical protein